MLKGKPKRKYFKMLLQKRDNTTFLEISSIYRLLAVENVYWETTNRTTTTTITYKPNKQTRTIKVPEMAVTAQALEEYKSREGLLEKVTL